MKLFRFLLPILFYLSLGNVGYASDSLKIKEYLDSTNFFLQEGEKVQACNYIKKAILIQDTLYRDYYMKEVKALRSTNQIDELYLQNKKQDNIILTRFILFLSLILLLSLALVFYFKKKNKVIAQSKIEIEAAKLMAEKSLAEKSAMLSTISRDIRESLYTISDAIEKKDKEKLKKGGETLKKGVTLFIFILMIAIQSPAIAQETKTTEDSLITSKIKSLSDSVIFYRGKNIDKANENLSLLKKYSEKGGNFDIYFRTWLAILDVHASNGNIEFVRNEALKMSKEAEKYNSPVGKVASARAIASSYYFLKDNESTIAILEDALKIEGIDDINASGIHSRLYQTYLNIKQFNSALEHLKKYEVLLKKYFIDNPKSNPNNTILNINNMFSSIYLSMGNYNSAKTYLDNASKYYSDKAPASMAVVYNLNWAKYYRLVNNYDNCFEYYRNAINILGNNQPLLKQGIMKDLATSLESSGDYDKALHYYQLIYKASDSLNNDFIERQRVTISENYRWEQGLIKHAKNENTIKIISVCFISLLCLITLSFALWLLRTNKKLKSGQESIEKAAKTAKAADNLKDTLIKNLKNEVYLPINKVIDDINTYLSNGEKKKEMTILEKEIITEAKSIIPMIDSIRDLSFLETGQMEMKISQYDIVSICYDSIDRVKYDSRIEIKFSSKVNVQMVNVDYNRLLDCLVSALTSPPSYQLTETIEFNLGYGGPDQNIIIEFIGTPLAKQQFSNREHLVRNNINKLVIESFGGNYNLKISNLRPELTITIPFKD